MSINAYPLCWPEGWPRTASTERKSANFGRRDRGGSGYPQKRELSVTDGVQRVLEELVRLGIDRQDIVISTNVRTRLDGLPRSGEREPDDAGGAVYWVDREARNRVMAIDRYDRVADNLAAIAATLDALRAIERHGGGQILERAFTGFTALPDPANTEDWRSVLGVPGCRSLEVANQAYLRLRSKYHTDRGGDAAMFHKVTLAIAAAKKEFGQ